MSNKQAGNEFEREKYEKYLGQRADLLCVLCEQRGIKLWEKE